MNVQKRAGINASPKTKIESVGSILEDQLVISIQVTDFFGIKM